MKSFKQYITPAVSRVPEVLPHGFSIKGSPISAPNNKPKPVKEQKPLTFAQRLQRAKERASK